MGNPAPHRARKRFGQHFLHDQNIIQKIIAALHPRDGDRIVEIGPGQGALTIPLLRVCKRLTAIELDRDLIPVLQRKAEKLGDLSLINEDVLKVDLAELGLAPPLRIVGNLPYNISTPLMFHLMTFGAQISDMTFMLQKEVALRINAEPGSKLYGKLSVMMRYYCDSEYLFDVPPGCFSPPPKVDSAVIRLEPKPRNQLVQAKPELLELLVSAAFNQRRKTISNSLKHLLTRDSIESLGIDPGTRAENLSLQQFTDLSNCINSK